MQKQIFNLVLSLLSVIGTNAVAQKPVAEATLTVENILFQVNGGAISFLPGYPSETSIYTLLPISRTLSEAFGTLTPMQSEVSTDRYSFAGGITAQNASAMQTLFAHAATLGGQPNAHENVYGFVNTGRSSSQPNVRLAPNTTVILTFDVTASTSVSVGPGQGMAISDLSVFFGGDHLEVSSCAGSTGNGDCTSLIGIPDRAHIIWELSSGAAQMDTFLYFQASAAVIEVSAVPESSQSTLLFVGLLLLGATRRRPAPVSASAA